MYVCELCHNSDMNAIDCLYTFEIHEHITDVEIEECDICGRTMPCIFCEEYQAEMMIRKNTKKEIKP